MTPDGSKAQVAHPSVTGVSISTAVTGGQPALGAKRWAALKMAIGGTATGGASGTTTPPSVRHTGIPGASGFSAFAPTSALGMQRMPSLQHGFGSAPVFGQLPGGGLRLPSIPGAANSAWRSQHTRNPSTGHAQAGQLCQPPQLQPSALLGLPPLLATAQNLTVGGSLNQLLEALPTFGSDVDVPIGGDLTITMRFVEGLTAGFNSNEKLVAVEAKMVVLSSDPNYKDKQEKLRATVSWTAAADPSGPAAAGGGGLGGLLGGGGVSSWGTGRIQLNNHQEVFRDIPASAELQIDFFIAKGTEQTTEATSSSTTNTEKKTTTGGKISAADARRSSAQIAGKSARAGRGSTGSLGNAAGGGGGGASLGTVGAGGGGINGGGARGPQPLRPTPAPRHHHTAHMSYSTGQFAGSVRVPLLLTLGRDKEQEWLLPLERKAGWQMVRGHVALSFDWSVTNEGMLMREVAALEYILAEKVELLALLNPLPSTETASFVRVPGSMQPVPSSAIVRAGSTDSTRPLNLAAGGAAMDSVMPSLPVNRTTRAMAESYYVNLDVSVLEVTGLLPREGLRAGIASTLYGRQNANMVSTAMLPCVSVVMTCAGETREAAAGINSVHPRFPKNTNTFTNVPLGSRVKVQVVDQLSHSYTKLLAEAEMHVSDVPVRSDPR